MKFIKLTRPDGSPIYYSDSGGGIIITVPPKTAAEWTKTRVIVAGDPQDVNETIEDVLLAFEQAG